jgi:hypothetical protein
MKRFIVIPMCLTIAVLLSIAPTTFACTTTSSGTLGDGDTISLVATDTGSSGSTSTGGYLACFGTWTGSSCSTYSGPSCNAEGIYGSQISGQIGYVSIKSGNSPWSATSGAGYTGTYDDVAINGNSCDSSNWPSVAAYLSGACGNVLVKGNSIPSPLLGLALLGAIGVSVVVLALGRSQTDGAGWRRREVAKALS